jgi:hypothetical protein
MDLAAATNLVRSDMNRCHPDTGFLVGDDDSVLYDFVLGTTGPGTDYGHYKAPLAEAYTVVHAHVYRHLATEQTAVTNSLPATVANPTLPPEYIPHSYGFMCFAIETDGYGGFSAVLPDGRQWLYASKYDFSDDLHSAYTALTRVAWQLGQNPLTDPNLSIDSRVKVWPNGEALPTTQGGDPMGKDQ